MALARIDATVVMPESGCAAVEMCVQDIGTILGMALIEIGCC